MTTGVTTSRRRLETLAIRVLAFALVLFLLAPLLTLALTLSLPDLVRGLQHPLVVPALRLSLTTTATSLLVVTILGTPLAWVLARSRGSALRWLESLLQLPVVVPPAVAGLALLLTFGRRSPLSNALFGGSLSLTSTTAAVVLAEVFVSAPFYLQAAVAAFRRIDPATLLVARSFGATPGTVFVRVALPLSAPGLAAGAASSWARSLGEFGATLMFAGNLTGRTQTLPLAVYTALETDLRAAQALAIVLVAVALALLVAVRGVGMFQGRRAREAG